MGGEDLIKTWFVFLLSLPLLAPSAVSYLLAE